MSKESIKQLSDDTFIDNEDFAITPAAHRNFNDQLIAEAAFTEDVDAKLGTKVDTQPGKGLSTNDYDDTDKERVGLLQGATGNIQGQINSLKEQGRDRGVFDFYATGAGTHLVDVADPKEGDYAYVSTDETHSGESWRYEWIVEDGAWKALMRVNEVPRDFTTNPIQSNELADDAVTDKKIGGRTITNEATEVVTLAGTLAELLSSLSGRIAWIKAKITNLFDTATGHNHDGVNSRKIDYSTILNQPESLPANGGTADALNIPTIADITNILEWALQQPLGKESSCFCFTSNGSPTNVRCKYTAKVYNTNRVHITAESVGNTNAVYHNECYNGTWTGWRQDCDGGNAATTQALNYGHKELSNVDGNSLKHYNLSATITHADWTSGKYCLVTIPINSVLRIELLHFHSSANNNTSLLFTVQINSSHTNVIREYGSGMIPGNSDLNAQIIRVSDSEIYFAFRDEGNSGVWFINIETLTDYSPSLSVMIPPAANIVVKSVNRWALISDIYSAPTVKSNLTFTQAELDANSTFVCSVGASATITLQGIPTVGKQYIFVVKNTSGATITITRTSGSTDSANANSFDISTGAEREVSMWYDGTRRRWIYSEEM